MPDIGAPVTLSGVRQVRRDPATGAERNLVTTVLILRDSLLQAGQGSSCPCCGEDWPADGGAHTDDCYWPALVEGGYVAEGGR